LTIEAKRDEKDFDAARHAFLAFGACVSTKEDRGLGAVAARGASRAESSLFRLSIKFFSLSARVRLGQKNIFDSNVTQTQDGAAH